MDTCRIDARFNGPPGSANGGYAAGTFADAAGIDVAEVTLRSPPPLDVDMDVGSDADIVRITYEQNPIAEVTAARGSPVAPPYVPTLEEAIDASSRYVGAQDHAYPTCFVCGPAREDGLRIFPGDVGPVVAARWRLDDTAIEGGLVRPVFVAAALDCPSGWAGIGQGDISPFLLGRISLFRRAVPADVDLIATGWFIGMEGRKMRTGSAIVSSSGEVLASSLAVWIRVAH